VCQNLFFPAGYYSRNGKDLLRHKWVAKQTAIEQPKFGVISSK